MVVSIQVGFANTLNGIRAAREEPILPSALASGGSRH